ncbi:MAG: flagellar protein FlaG [Roseburia sp.]|jgi:flagellar protein FlaG|nr:flagellar protein FlaG [Roseburia sp.]
MAIEAMKGAGMSYAGSSSASDVKAESQAKVETASNAAASDDLMKKTIQIDTKETDKNGKDGNRDDSQAKQTISENSQIRKAVDEINKKAHNSEAVFGIHDATNRVTIKIVDKDTKKVLKEYPPEKTLDMIAKVWEMAGLLVDQKL